MPYNYYYVYSLYIIGCDLFLAIVVLSFGSLVMKKLQKQIELNWVISVNYYNWEHYEFFSDTHEIFVFLVKVHDYPSDIISNILTTHNHSYKHNQENIN